MSTLDEDAYWAAEAMAVLDRIERGEERVITLEQWEAQHGLWAEVTHLQRDVASNSVQVAALGQQMAGLTVAVFSGKSDFEDIKRRVERLEQRFENKRETTG